MNNINKKTTPRVSVIIGVYNHAKYLAESINSVLNQTYKDFELIIINDASPDNSKEIIKEIIKKNPGKITFIDNKINSKKNGTFSSNQGVDAARGEFIAWNDDDDICIRPSLKSKCKFSNRIIRKELD